MSLTFYFGSLVTLLLSIDLTETNGADIYLIVSPFLCNWKLSLYKPFAA